METIDGLREETLTTITFAIQKIALSDYHAAEIYLSTASQKVARLRAMETDLIETINQ